MFHHVLLGECVGSVMLILFGCGVVANVLLSGSKGENGGWMAVTTGWFIAVVVGVFVARSLGSANADINPAVTIAKLMIGTYSVYEACLIILFQLIGCFVGAVLVWLSYWPHWSKTQDPLRQRDVFCTAPAIRCYPANVFTEAMGTFVLVFAVGAIFGRAVMVHPESGLGPYLVGVIVWGIGLSLGGPTGYAINPARDLGPRLAHFFLPIKNKADSNWSYAWVPVLGPVIGGLLGGIAWKAFFL